MEEVELYRIHNTKGLGIVLPKPEGKVWVRLDDIVLYLTPTKARVLYEALKPLRRRHII